MVRDGQGYAHARVTIVRYADDFVTGVERAADARRMTALKERLAGFGLQLREAKTRLIEFGRLPVMARKQRRDRRPETFAFLGFTHYRGCARDGRFVMKRETQSCRLTRRLKAIRREARQRMHQPLALRHRWLASVPRGHHGYSGVPSDWRSLNVIRQDIRWIWLKCLQRRSQKNRRVGWEWFDEVTAHLPLPLPHIRHPWTTRRS